jgi:maleylpyruvate isomerase
MKLYSANLSPYASRARLAIYAKGLAVEIAPPPGGLGSEEYRAINPIGKVPCLVLDDGTVIPESSTILEYFEDAFPDKPLRPRSPEAAAKTRLVARIGELYVMEPIHRLFDYVDPAKRDAAAVDAIFAELETGLQRLNLFLSGEAFAAGPEFGLADCEITPVLFYVAVLGPFFGRGALMAGHPKVSAYWEGIKRHPAASRVLGELSAALAHFQKTGEAA